MLTYNREMTQEEYRKCYEMMQTCVSHAKDVPFAPQSREATLKMISYMLPLLMMRHRRVPRLKWRDRENGNGKHWIEQDAENPMNPTHRLRAMIGYHLAIDTSIVGMVMTQGHQREVINIGLGVKQMIVPPNTSVSAYAESEYHKLTPLELSCISSNEEDDVILRRLCLLLALKQAYIKAIGQPIGFDLSRLEFNIPEETASGDGHALQGWEFRIWQAHIAVMRDGDVSEEWYQCAAAFFRGSDQTKFIWQKTPKELESWVQFLNVDQLVTVLPKLAD